MAGALTNQSWKRAQDWPKIMSKGAGHLAAVANEGDVSRGAVGPAANGRRCGCGGSVFELAAAADGGGWHRR